MCQLTAVIFFLKPLIWIHAAVVSDRTCVYILTPHHTYKQPYIYIQTRTASFLKSPEDSVDDGHVAIPMWLHTREATTARRPAGHLSSCKDLTNPTPAPEHTPTKKREVWSILFHEDDAVSPKLSAVEKK